MTSVCGLKYVGEKLHGLFHNVLIENMFQKTYISRQTLYTKDVHAVMALIQIRIIFFIDHNSLYTCVIAVSGFRKKEKML